MEKFRCIKKCYFNEQRWREDQVFTYKPGGFDPNGKPLLTPDEAGMGKYFEPVTAAEAVRALDRFERDREEKSSRPLRRKSAEPIDFKDKYDTHD